jgi:hypothetical protein
MRVNTRLARQWTPAELGAHPVAGAGPGEGVSYRYGCEPDLTPAPPWRWALRQDPARPAERQSLVVQVARPTVTVMWAPGGGPLR